VGIGESKICVKCLRINRREREGKGEFNFSRSPLGWNRISNSSLIAVIYRYIIVHLFVCVSVCPTTP